MGTAATPAVERDIALDLVKHGLLVARRDPRRRPRPRLGRRGERGDRARHRARQLPRRRARRVVGRDDLDQRRPASPRPRGYVVRLARRSSSRSVLLRHASWIDFPMLGITLVGTHLGLLVWETKYVSLSLAAPGLRPANPHSPETNDCCSRSTSRRSATVTIWGDIGPLGLNKTGLIYLFATLATLILFLVGTRRRSSSCRAASAEHRGVGRRLRPQPGHHADDGHRRPRLPAAT